MKINKETNKETTFFKKLKNLQETKIHTIPRFPSGTVAVKTGDNLRFNLGIICGAVQVSIQRSKIN